MAFCLIPPSDHLSLLPAVEGPWRWVQSYQDAQTIPLHIAKLIGETYPLRSTDASNALRQTLKKIVKSAPRDGLTELDIGKIIHEEWRGGAYRHRYQCPDHRRAIAKLRIGAISHSGV